MSATTKPSAPRGGQPAGSLRSLLNRMVVLVALVTLLVSALGHVRNPLLPEIASDFGIDAGSAAAIVTAFGLGRLIADIPAGYIADRFRPSVVLTVASVLLAGALLWFGVSNSMVQASVASVVAGIVSGLATGVASTTIARGVDRGMRATALSIYTISLHIGAAIGPLIGGVLAELWHWRVALISAGGLALLVVIPALLIRPARSAPATGPGAAEAPPERLTIPVRLGISTVPFAIFMVNSSLPQILIPYIGNEELGLNAAVIGGALALAGIARIAGGWVFGRIADRVSRHAAIVPSMVLMAVSVFLLALPPAQWSWFASIVIMMFSVSTVPAAAALLADRVPRERIGRATGMFRFLGDLGMIVGPALAGALYASMGATVSAVAVGGVVLMLLAAFVLLVPRTDR